MIKVRKAGVLQVLSGELNKYGSEISIGKSWASIRIYVVAILRGKY
jgi:hypothetical protein